RGERLDWFASREIWIYLATSVTSLALFAWRELTVEHPVVDLRILAGRQLAVGVTFGGMLGVCLYGTVFMLPVYLQQLQGFTANLLTRFQVANHAALAQNVTRFSDVTREQLATMTQALIARGVLPGVATQRAIAMLDAEVSRQAMMMSFERLFLLYGLALTL